MFSVRALATGVIAAAIVVACKPAERVVDSAATKPAPSEQVGDSIPEERPDSIVTLPPDSATMLLSLLPASAGGAVDGEQAALAERAVFAPRTQRWFMAKLTDSVYDLDIGRLDGGVGATESARTAALQTLAARSPIRAGMRFVLHPRSGAVIAPVLRLGIKGRRIIAEIERFSRDSVDVVVPVEWRGDPPAPITTGTRTACVAGDTLAITAATQRLVPLPTESISALHGCFGDFRAIVVIRPREITPESVERVVLVRANGGTRSGRLRDLSYPLHHLISVTDVNHDGIDEIIVQSFRPAMETWAALRMTDSVSFTRFSSGFTIEKR
jgi:hypothetical protein